MTPNRRPIPKYVLAPGMVRSANDGQWHHGGGYDLARLYGVSMSECLVWHPGDVPRPPMSLPVLAPRSNGIYQLPEYDGMRNDHDRVIENPASRHGERDDRDR